LKRWSRIYKAKARRNLPKKTEEDWEDPEQKKLTDADRLSAWKQKMPISKLKTIFSQTPGKASGVKLTPIRNINIIKQ